MDETDICLLKRNGWEVECNSPFEIRHEDGSFATLNAAESILVGLKLEEITDEEVTLYIRNTYGMSVWPAYKTLEGEGSALARAMVDAADEWVKDRIRASRR